MAIGWRFRPKDVVRLFSSISSRRASPSLVAQDSEGELAAQLANNDRNSKRLLLRLGQQVRQTSVPCPAIGSAVASGSSFFPVADALQD